MVCDLHLLSYYLCEKWQQEDHGIEGKLQTKTNPTYFEYRTIGAQIFRTFPFSNMSITPEKLFEVFIVDGLLEAPAALVA